MISILRIAVFMQVTCHTHTYTHTRAHTHTCTHTHTHLHTYTHLHTLTHIYTHLHRRYTTSTGYQYQNVYGRPSLLLNFNYERGRSVNELQDMIVCVVCNVERAEGLVWGVLVFIREENRYWLMEIWVTFLA